MKRLPLRIAPFPFLSLFIILITGSFSHAQNKSENSILISIESKTIALNEPLVVHIDFPSTFKKEFKAAQAIIFPDIPDMEKGQTLYESDKELKISQWYWPRKSGTYTTPEMNFNIRDYDVSMRKTNITVKASKSNFSYTTWKADEAWEEHNPDIELLWLYPKTKPYERELFDLELSVLVPKNNRAEWNFVDIKEQIQDISKKIGATGLLVQAETDTQIPMDSFEREHTTFYKYTIYKAKAIAVDTNVLKLPSIPFHYIAYKTQHEKKGWGNNLSLIKRIAVNKELSTKPVSLRFKALPPHPLKNDVAVGNFNLRTNRLKRQQSTKGFDCSFEITGPRYPMALHEPWSVQTIPGLHVYLSKQDVNTKENTQTTRFHYFIHSDNPKTINLKNSLVWVFFNPSIGQYDSLSVNQTLVLNTSVEDHQGLGQENSFEQMLYKASNTLYSLEKDESLNRFANFIIFILFLAISVLIFKR